MCLICIEYHRGRLTPSEARFNLGEMSLYISQEHVEEIEDMLDEAEKDYDEHTDSERSFEVATEFGGIQDTGEATKQR